MLFYDEKNVLFGWSRRLPVSLAWFKEGDAVVFKHARIQIWIRETACLIRPTLHLVGRWAAQTSRVRVSAFSRPSLPPYHHFNRPLGFWSCVKSCLVGGCDKYKYSCFKKKTFGEWSFPVLGSFCCVWKGWFIGDGWETKISSRYINVFQKRIFPFMNRLDINNTIFQQHNTPMHTSKLIKHWFKTKNIEVLNWPTKSLYLTLIEHLWGIFVEKCIRK